MGMYGHYSCPINGKRTSRTRGCEFSRQDPENHQEWIGQTLPGGRSHHRELALLGRYLHSLRGGAGPCSMWLTATSDSSARKKGNHARTSIRIHDDPLQPKHSRSPKTIRNEGGVGAAFRCPLHRTIEKWMKAGILIFLKVNRVVRFHVEGCDDALRKRGFLS